ncbi:MAG: glycosyltransferase [Planctomycetota bacterium]|nr:glycosyltransferase [Planctomycetota bacterium]
MDPEKGNLRVCLAHDWLVGLRGGEWVLDRLACLYGPTTLYTLVNDGRFLTDAIADCEVLTSPLQRFPKASGRWRRAYLPLMPWAVGRLKVKPCDLLVSTSSAVMKSIRPPDGAKHICYCHSPARYVWDQMDDYTQGSGGMFRSLGLRLVRTPLQRWDRKTASRVDRFLANSSHTARRIKACYGREAVVVHPPVRTRRFTIERSIEREDFYLVVAALEPYKRTELALEAARKMGFKLTIAGGGTQFDRLKLIAPSNVTLSGRVSEDELLSLYRRAKALIFPQTEDFGIVPVEAQATGCPVIAFKKGGATETITDATGVFFDQPEIDGLIEAIGIFEARSKGEEFTVEACRDNAQRFAEAVFDDAIRREVDIVMSKK